jgi:hypothetical protein
MIIASWPEEVFQVVGLPQNADTPPLLEEVILTGASTTDFGA